MLDELDIDPESARGFVEANKQLEGASSREPKPKGSVSAENNPNDAKHPINLENPEIPEKLPLNDRNETQNELSKTQPNAENKHQSTVFAAANFEATKTGQMSFCKGDVIQVCVE